MVWTVGTMTDVSLAVFRERFLMVAKAPCLNNYIFANIYGAAHLIAASSGVHLQCSPDHHCQPIAKYPVLKDGDYSAR